MTNLYTYVIDTDDGAAPNPYWGICTLAICKPAIRRTAKIGDWVVGTGGKNSPLGDIRGKVIYAMRITDVQPMMQYDLKTRTDRILRNKIPDWNNRDVRRRLGDSIYDYSQQTKFGPLQRRGVHDQSCYVRDLSGKNVLLSNHFYYFGSAPKQLPDTLVDICKTGQGHRVHANKGFLTRFLQWIGNLGPPSQFEIENPGRDLFSSKFRASCNAHSIGLDGDRGCNPKGLAHRRRKPSYSC